MDRRIILLVVLGIHLIVAVAHGTTHALIPVVLPPWQNAIVVGTVFIGPVAGVGFALRRHPIGIPLFTVSMVGALLVSGILHFLIENPDHVHAVPVSPWRFAFQASAVGVAILPAIGTGVGLWYWRPWEPQ